MTEVSAAPPPGAYLPSCAGCRFWDQHIDHQLGHVGDCRRHAPRIVDKLVIPTADDDSGDGFERATAWPATFNGEWCGEHAARSA